MKIHSPLPEALASEFNKAASILDHFIKGTKKWTRRKLFSCLIPTKIIANCKGVAVLTLIKAGFVWSGRAGAGLVVARLPDGRWSAPCAIGAAGAGFGAQIGAELTDCVFILNTESAVRAFSHGGNVTFGANLSVAAGPVGRQAEGAGTVANLAPIYAYSKTKGLFAGLSLEGLVIITRKETNATFYGQKVTPKELLSGVIEPPPGAEVLYRSLTFRGFGSNHTSPDSSGTTLPRAGSTNLAPSRTTLQDTLNRRNSAPRPTTAGSHLSVSSQPLSNTGSAAGSNANLNPSRPPANPPLPPKPFANRSSTVTSSSQNPPPAYESSSPPKPVPPRPAPREKETYATALYDFTGEREGDLSFKRGEKIVITKKTDSVNDWWEGKVEGSVKGGAFPANYVKV
ncbi:hypothetical protein BC829DRAFT_364370 [Chytridium lagenaria]|nr:hypothetical protein BC829DRAFT_364370 [Chytridium lagenaria]